MRLVFTLSLVFPLLWGLWWIISGKSSSSSLEAPARVPAKKMPIRITLVELLRGGIHRYQALQHDGTALSQVEVFQLWADEAKGRELRESMRQTLLSQDADAYFWECTPTSGATVSRNTFEFVVVPAPSLSGVIPDTAAFNSYYSGECSFATFLNMGGDALLVSPSPCKKRDYAHLANFIRNAPAEQGQELFAHVGRAVLSRLSDEPMWLSTSGAGIYWLHVRLDSRPKYYSFAPYKNAPV